MEIKEVMMAFVTLNLSRMAVVMVMSVFMHEFGHWFMLKKATKKEIPITLQFKGFSFKYPFIKLNLWVGELTHIICLSLDQKIKMYFFGIMFGCIPLVILGGYSLPEALILDLIYALGCNSDIQNIRRLNELKKQREVMAP